MPTYPRFEMKFLSTKSSILGDLIATTSYDRTVHIWGPEEMVKEETMTSMFQPQNTAQTKQEPMDDEE